VNIQNNYEGANSGSGTITSGVTHSTFNLLEKYIEAVDKIEKLYEELLKAKEEQIRILEKIAAK